MEKKYSNGKNALRLIHFLDKKKKSLSPLLILAHDYPDPDALASGFALYYLARHHYNINTRMVYNGIIGRAENREMVRILKIPLHKFKLVDLKRYNNIALVDTQPEFGNNPFPKDRRATIVVDQHQPASEVSADFVVVDEECGATSVIFAQAFLLLGIEMPARLATALAYGIITDTLNLYRAKREDIIKTYLDILPFCDMRALATIQNPLRSKKFFSTLNKGIKNARVNSKLIVSHLGFVENPDLVSQISDFLLTCKGISWSFCTGRYHGKLHVSFRAIDSSVLAAKILQNVFENPEEAGGHDNIAGGSFDVGKEASDYFWQKHEDGLVQRLLDGLDISSKRKFSFPFQEK